MVDIDIKKPIMVHDFGVTSKYAIFLDLPLVFDPSVMVLKNRLPFDYKKDIPARFGFLPRYSENCKDTVWFNLPNQFIFHVINSWDIEGTNKVIMYACRYDEINLNVSEIGVYNNFKGKPNRAVLT